MSERDDSINKVARELWLCAMAWNPDERLLGNVRAEDIARLCAAYVREFDPGDPEINPYAGPQCTCNQPTRFGYCPVHEADRLA